MNGAPAALVIGQPDFFSFACDAGVAGGDVNGVGPDSLCEPGGVAVDSAGNLYVADSNDNRVLEFAQPFNSGKTKGQSAHLIFGQGLSFTTAAPGGGVDGLNRPTGVALDPDGDVFVADTNNSRVLEYNNPLAGSGSTPGVSGAAGDTTADLVFGQDANFATVACSGGTAGGDLSGVGLDSLCRPTGVALDQTGNLYVADYGNSRVLEYNTPLNASSGESGAAMPTPISYSAKTAVSPPLDATGALPGRCRWRGARQPMPAHKRRGRQCRQPLRRRHRRKPRAGVQHAAQCRQRRERRGRCERRSRIRPRQLHCHALCSHDQRRHAMRA